MEEIWVDVKGYEQSYQVSNLGRVRSKDEIKIVNNKFLGKSYERPKKGKILNPGIDSHGYHTVRLYKDKISKTHGIHVVVAISFLNHVPVGPSIVVDHIDNDKSNNKLSNVQVITHRQNISKDKKNKTSKYTGVYLSKYGKKYKWKAVIQNEKKKIFLGYYNCDTIAHFAYLKKLNSF
jgi:hypothetical protein